MTQMRLLKQTVQTDPDFSRTRSTEELQELSLAGSPQTVSGTPNVTTSLLSDPENLRQKSRPFDLQLPQLAFLLLDIPFEMISLGVSTYNVVTPSSLLLTEDLTFTCAVGLTRTLAALSLLKSEDYWLRICCGALTTISLFNCITTGTNLFINGSGTIFRFVSQYIFAGPTLVILYIMTRLQNYKKEEYDLCCRDQECFGD